MGKLTHLSNNRLSVFLVDNEQEEISPDILRKFLSNTRRNKCSLSIYAMYYGEKKILILIEIPKS